MNADALCRQAVQLQQSGQLVQAESLYRQALQADSGHVPSLMLLGQLCLRQDRAAEALGLFDRAQARQPDLAGAHAGRAMALKQLAQLDQALAAYDGAVARDGGNAALWNNRGNILTSLHRHAEALASFDRALALKPDFADAHFNRGNVLQSLLRHDEALASYGNADLGNAHVRNNRGITLLSLGRREQALEDFDAALALNPTFVPALHNRGNTLVKLGRLPEALAAYDAALAREPGNARILAHRGRALCEAGDIAGGFASFMRGAVDAPVPPRDLPHRQRHDAEQETYIGAGTDALRLDGGARLAGGAVRADDGEVAARWQAASPQIVVIDNFLTDEALNELRRFCLGSTVWRETYADGYVGAFPEHGFACPLLAQIAEEMRAAYPAIFRDHPLHYLWAFKYDSKLKGTAIHADAAAVNVNFWITPDEANLDPARGGLVIWDKAAPLDWSFERFNGDVQATRDFLAQSGAAPIIVPYRANRAVIFDSDLFHETDAISFADGYENRRINVTLLYGKREHGAR